LLDNFYRIWRFFHWDSCITYREKFLERY